MGYIEKKIREKAKKRRDEYKEMKEALEFEENKNYLEEESEDIMIHIIEPKKNKNDGGVKLVDIIKNIIKKGNINELFWE